MSSHSPSQASVCVFVCAEKRCIDPSTDSVRESALGMLHAIYWLTFTRPGDGLSILQPQLQWETKDHAHNCPQEVANVRWGIRESVSHGEVTLGHIRHVPGLQVTVETFVGLAHPICQLDADGVWSALIGILLLQEKCVNTGY